MSETVDLSLELLDVQLIDFSRLSHVLVLLGEHMDLVLKGFDNLGHSVKLSAHGVVLLIELFVLINHEFYAVIKHKATYG